MSERSRRPLAAAALLLFVAGATRAEARAMIHATTTVRLPPTILHRGLEAPRSFARTGDRRSDFSRRRDLNRGTVAAWPYPWFPDSAPAPTEAPSPQVIVLSNAANNPPARPVLASLPDFSYVPGCHAIQNGYHCDIPRKTPSP